VVAAAAAVAVAVAVARAGPEAGATKGKALFAPHFVVAVGGGYFSFGLDGALRVSRFTARQNLHLVIWTSVFFSLLKTGVFQCFIFGAKITHYVVLAACWSCPVSLGRGGRERPRE